MKKRTWFIVLCLLLMLNASAATVKYTIISRTAVEASGTEPEDSYVTYYQSCAGQKGQMTAGSYTQLTIHVEQDMVVSGLTLEMHSNTSSGGGSLDVFADKQHAFNLPTNYFNTDTWAGTYTTTFIPLDFFFSEPITAHDSLRIILAAFDNSIYVRSYTLTYNMGPKHRYTVMFDDHVNTRPWSIHEREGGSGVVLPKVADQNEWYFYGWSENVFNSPTSTKPIVYMAGETYYPHENMLLHAVYTDAQTAFWTQTIVPTSGLYLMAVSRDSCMAYGKINSQKKLSTMRWIPTMNSDSLYICTLEEFPESSVYEINFMPDSMAVIRHYASSSLIASRKNALAKDSTAWHYRILPDNSFAFYVPEDDIYAYTLLSTYGTSVNTWDSLWISCDRYNLQSVRKDGLILFNLDNQPREGEALYTSYPVMTAIDDLKNQSLIMTNGILKNESGDWLMLYSCTGLLVLSTNTDIPMQYLPHGIYILQTKDGRLKIRL